MRTRVTTICILFAAILLVSPQAGFAYSNVNQGCTTCHPAPAGGGLHTPHASLTCGICHAGGVPGKNVEASACIVCHPRGNTGLCPLIDLPAHDSQKATCLTCHPSCAPATTTTTAAGTTTTTPATTTVPATTSAPATSSVPETTTIPASTTTTTPSETTTTTTPQDGCNVNGPGRSCQSCHAATFAFGTSWHTSHQGYVGINCERCHIGGFGAAIPTNVCKACHNESASPAVSLPCDWVELNATHKAVCLSCHADCNEETPPPPGPCPAEVVLGEDDPRLDTLRAFRDQMLVNNPNGQKMIKLYYDSSDAVVQMLEKNPGLKESAREYLESILPAIEMMTKQKANRK